MTPNPAWYLDDYADEVLPSMLEGATLEGWAAWLSKGGERQREDGGGDSFWAFDPPADGTEFKASRLTFDEDIHVARKDDEDCAPVFEFSREGVGGYDFAALRFDKGMGWDGDSILDPGSVEEQLADDVCPMLEPGDDGYLAVARSADLIVRYRANPPRLEVVGEVQ